MGKGQHVVLITRRIGLGDEDEAEIVIGVRVGDQELMLPMDAKIQVEYDAGQSLGMVTMTVYADTVRHEREPERDPANHSWCCPLDDPCLSHRKSEPPCPLDDDD